MYQIPCPDCTVIGPGSVVLSLLSCPYCRVFAILSSLNCPGYTNLTDLSGCLAPAVLSSISCTSCSVQAFSSLRSCASLLVPSTFVPYVLSLLTYSDRPVLSVLSWIPCASCPAPIFPSCCPVLAFQKYPYRAY
jgi:hypothetical protein